MFSGIVKGFFPVKSVHAQQNETQYSVELSSDLIKDLQIGASISIDGVCQTVVKIDNHAVYFDAIQETLDKTTLSELHPERLVNVERSLRFGDEVGGHLLSGHVVDTVVIQKIDQNVFTIQCDPKWIKYILPKGFIALDGASLTIVDVDPRGTFTVHLIPETLRLTTFGFKKEGDSINLEIDSQTQAIVDTIERSSALADKTQMNSKRQENSS